MEPIVVTNSPLPKGRGGRPKGSGCNLRLLARIASGGCILNLEEKKARSLFETGRKRGIKLKIRRLPFDEGYGIWKI